MTYQDYSNIAALAWHIVKDANDPEFTKCAADHQSRLAYKVESVHKSGARDDQFDHHAAQMLTMPKEEWVSYARSCDESKRLMADLQARTAQAAEAALMAMPLEVEKHAKHGDEIMLAERGTEDSEDLPTEPKSKSVKPKKGKAK